MYTFSFATRFLLVPLPFIILYSPNSNLLDNVGVLLRLNSLCCVYHNIYIFSQAFLYLYKFIYNNNGKCVYCVLCASTIIKALQCLQTTTTKASSSLTVFTHHGAYSLIITISIYSHP